MVEPGSQRPVRVVLADSPTLTSLAELPVHTLAELGFVPADPDGSALGRGRRPQRRRVAQPAGRVHGGVKQEAGRGIAARWIDDDAFSRISL